MKNVRADFPLLAQHDVAYLDNASSTLKPQPVIGAITEYYTDYSVNVHRGVYDLSETASEKYEATRAKVRDLLNAQYEEEIVFTSGTTQSFNLAVRLLSQELKEGDEIILTRLEHHASIVPWQIVAKERGFVLKFMDLNEDGELEPEALHALITDKSKILAVTHISNASGYITPAAELTSIAHEHGMRVIIDAAQSVPHMPVDVQNLNCDMLAFSAHKMCAPTGVGVLYGKKELLESLEPVFGGGSMIDTVSDHCSTWAPLPLKLEPGTPNVSGVIGFGAAIDYINSIGIGAIEEHERALTTYAREQLGQLEDITTLGPSNPDKHSGILSFVSPTVHPHDMAQILNSNNVAVRSGHHCAQPLMKVWDVPATTRASFYFYNTEEDVDRLVKAIQKAQETFSK